jgi:hypothetical protein
VAAIAARRGPLLRLRLRLRRSVRLRFRLCLGLSLRHSALLVHLLRVLTLVVIANVHDVARGAGAGVAYSCTLRSAPPYSVLLGPRAAAAAIATITAIIIALAAVAAAAATAAAAAAIVSATSGRCLAHLVPSPAPPLLCSSAEAACRERRVRVVCAQRWRSKLQQLQK